MPAIDPFADMIRPTPHQLRAIRSYLNWTQIQCAAELKINYQTLMRIEKVGTPDDRTMATIVANLERLGLTFDKKGNLVLPPQPPEIQA